MNFKVTTKTIDTPLGRSSGWHPPKNKTAMLVIGNFEYFTDKRVYYMKTVPTAQAGSTSSGRQIAEFMLSFVDKKLLPGDVNNCYNRMNEQERVVKNVLNENTEENIEDKIKVTGRMNSDVCLDFQVYFDEHFELDGLHKIEPGKKIQRIETRASNRPTTLAALFVKMRENDCDYLVLLGPPSPRIITLVNAHLEKIIHFVDRRKHISVAVGAIALVVLFATVGLFETEFETCLLRLFVAACILVCIFKQKFWTTWEHTDSKHERALLYGIVMIPFMVWMSAICIDTILINIVTGGQNIIALLYSFVATATAELPEAIVVTTVATEMTIFSVIKSIAKANFDCFMELLVLWRVPMILFKALVAFCQLLQFKSTSTFAFRSMFVNVRDAVTESFSIWWEKKDTKVVKEQYQEFMKAMMEKHGNLIATFVGLYFWPSLLSKISENNESLAIIANLCCSCMMIFRTCFYLLMTRIFMLQWIPMSSALKRWKQVKNLVQAINALNKMKNKKKLAAGSEKIEEKEFAASESVEEEKEWEHVSGWHPSDERVLVCYGHSSLKSAPTEDGRHGYHMENGEFLISYTDPLCLANSRDSQKWLNQVKKEKKIMERIPGNTQFAVRINGEWTPNYRFSCNDDNERGGRMGLWVVDPKAKTVNQVESWNSKYNETTIERLFQESLQEHNCKFLVVQGCKGASSSPEDVAKTRTETNRTITNIEMFPNDVSVLRWALGRFWGLAGKIDIAWWTNFQRDRLFRVVWKSMIRHSKNDEIQSSGMAALRRFIQKLKYTGKKITGTNKGADDIIFELVQTLLSDDIVSANPHALKWFTTVLMELCRDKRVDKSEEEYKNKKKDLTHFPKALNKSW